MIGFKTTFGSSKLPISTKKLKMIRNIVFEVRNFKFTTNDFLSEKKIKSQFFNPRESERILTYTIQKINHILLEENGNFYQKEFSRTRESINVITPLLQFLERKNIIVRVRQNKAVNIFPDLQKKYGSTALVCCNYTYFISHLNKRLSVVGSTRTALAELGMSVTPDTLRSINLSLLML